MAGGIVSDYHDGKARYAAELFFKVRYTLPEAFLYAQGYCLTVYCHLMRSMARFQARVL